MEIEFHCYSLSDLVHLREFLSLEHNIRDLIKPDISDETYDTPLSLLNISTKINTLLGYNDIHKVGELLHYTETQLLAMPKMTKKSIKGIKEAIKTLGVKLSKV